MADDDQDDKDSNPFDWGPLYPCGDDKGDDWGGKADGKGSKSRIDFLMPPLLGGRDRKCGSEEKPKDPPEWTLEEQVAFLQKELDEKTEEIEHLKAEVNIYSGMVDDYEEKIEKTNQKIIEHNENIRKWRAAHEVLKKQNEELTKRRGSMQKDGKVSETFADLQDIEKEVVDFRKQDIRFDDVGGIGRIRGKIDEFAAGIKHYDMHEQFALDAPRGLLLHGPPGCGKTMLAMAMANEMECDFLLLPPTRIGSGIVTRSSRRLEFVLKKFVEKFRKDRIPTMIFVDEADGMLKKRGSAFGVSTYDDIVNVWLRYLQGSEDNEGLILVAATNRFDMVDDAIVRAGRVNYVLEVPKPDRTGVEDILRKQVIYRHRRAKREFYMIDDYSRLADMLYGKQASGADIAAVLEQPARGRILQFAELPEDIPISADDVLICQQELEEAVRNYAPSDMMRRKEPIGFGKGGRQVLVG